MFVPDKDGHQFEMSFFGLTKPIYPFRRFKRLFRNRGDPTFYQCVQFAKWHQPQGYDPKKPKAEPAKEILWYIRRNLRKYFPPRECDDVALYVGLGMALDYFYGVDCFLYFQQRIVTIDLTVKKEKPPEAIRADVLLRSRDLVTYRKIGCWAEPVAKKTGWIG